MWHQTDNQIRYWLYQPWIGYQQFYKMYIGNQNFTIMLGTLAVEMHWKCCISDKLSFHTAAPYPNMQPHCVRAISFCCQCQWVLPHSDNHLPTLFIRVLCMWGHQLIHFNISSLIPRSGMGMRLYHSLIPRSGMEVMVYDSYAKWKVSKSLSLTRSCVEFVCRTHRMRVPVCPQSGFCWCNPQSSWELHSLNESDPLSACLCARGVYVCVYMSKCAPFPYFAMLYLERFSKCNTVDNIWSFYLWVDIIMLQCKHVCVWDLTCFLDLKSEHKDQRLELSDSIDSSV